MTDEAQSTVQRRLAEAKDRLAVLRNAKHAAQMIGKLHLIDTIEAMINDLELIVSLIEAEAGRTEPD